MSVVREPLLLKGKSHAKRQWVTSLFRGLPAGPARTEVFKLQLSPPDSDMYPHITEWMLGDSAAGTRVNTVTGISLNILGWKILVR